VFKNPCIQADRTNQVAKRPEEEGRSGQRYQQNNDYHQFETPMQKMKWVEVIIDTYSYCKDRNHKSYEESYSKKIGYTEWEYELGLFWEGYLMENFLNSTNRTGPTTKKFIP
jgi:hypothetical protein